MWVYLAMQDNQNRRVTHQLTLAYIFGETIMFCVIFSTSSIQIELFSEMNDHLPILIYTVMSIWIIIQQANSFAANKPLEWINEY